jgi:hypothetical protein
VGEPTLAREDMGGMRESQLFAVRAVELRAVSRSHRSGGSCRLYSEGHREPEKVLKGWGTLDESMRWQGHRQLGM